MSSETDKTGGTDEASMSGDGGDGDKDHTERAPAPSPPEELPENIYKPVAEQNIDDLRALAEWAADLAYYREHQAHLQIENQAEQVVEKAPDEWDEE